jgi:hypothetical protein
MVDTLVDMYRNSSNSRTPSSTPFCILMRPQSSLLLPPQIWNSITTAPHRLLNRLKNCLQLPPGSCLPHPATTRRRDITIEAGRPQHPSRSPSSRTRRTLVDQSTARASLASRNTTIPVHLIGWVPVVLQVAQVVPVFPSLPVHITHSLLLALRRQLRHIPWGVNPLSWRNPEIGNSVMVNKTPLPKPVCCANSRRVSPP